MQKSDQSPLARCKRASQHYPGAPISRVQLARVEDAITPAQKSRASKHRSALLTYARTGDRSHLPENARELLRDVNAMYDKAWARKSAAIVGDALVTRPPRKRASKRSQESPQALS